MYGLVNSKEKHQHGPPKWDDQAQTIKLILTFSDWLLHTQAIKNKQSSKIPSWLGSTSPLAHVMLSPLFISHWPDQFGCLESQEVPLLSLDKLNRHEGNRGREFGLHQLYGSSLKVTLQILKSFCWQTGAQHGKHLWQITCNYYDSPIKLNWFLGRH